MEKAREGMNATALKVIMSFQKDEKKRKRMLFGGMCIYPCSHTGGRRGVGVGLTKVVNAIQVQL